MATQSVIDELTQTIQDCLEDKLQAGFDAQAALTVDIAREVAGAVENKCNEYTDVEITKVMQLITDGEVDLGPFTEFMNTIKTLLDGDENTEGYQIFQTLITDTANNKQTLINHATSIALIQQNLTTMQATLVDHEDRIAALEAAQQEPMDCEDCHDEILNLVKGSMSSACTAVDTAMTAYYDANAESTLSAFAQEIDPVSVTATVTYDETAGTVAFAGEFTGRKVAAIAVDIDGIAQTVVFDAAAKAWSVAAVAANGVNGQTVTVKTVDANGAELGYNASAVITVPGNNTDGGSL